MMSWRDRLQTIAATMVLTSLAWMLIGLAWYSRVVERPPAPQIEVPLPSPTLQPLVGQTTRAPGRLVIPVANVGPAQLADTWGQTRQGGARRHEAIDIMAPRGTPVLAAAPGTVEKLFVSARGGNTIYVRSPDRRVIYYYAHLDRYAPGIAEGRQVRAGELLAYVGSTGDASPDGPHLHFAIHLARAEEGWWQGAPVNPYPLLRR